MGDRLDDLMGVLASSTAVGAPDDVEAAVWRRVDAHQAAARRARSGVALQCVIGACALVLGFSYRAYADGVGTTPRNPEPVLKLLDRSTVAEAGGFQVLQ